MAAHRHPKRRRFSPAPAPGPAPIDALADELLFLVLDRVAAADPRALKSFALASRACHAAESRHRRLLRPLRAHLLRAALARYPSASRLDLSLCARVPDAALAAVPTGSSLRAVDLSRSSGFGAAGLAALAGACPDLADLDLSNGVDLGDTAAAEVARMRRLQRLSLSRCKALTDMGLGCVAVGCTDLRDLSLKWCLGVTDLGLHLLALKCKNLTTLDLSYTMVSAASLCFLISSFLLGPRRRKTLSFFLSSCSSFLYFNFKAVSFLLLNLPASVNFLSSVYWLQLIIFLICKCHYRHIGN
jgi:F-box/leucine-rich repeat protein 2/20